MSLAPHDIIARDLNHIWHPCAQKQDDETFQPVVITGATGSYLHTADGRSLIDSGASWWCKLLGHNHPQLKQALLKQVDRFEHVMLSNTTNETIVQLSETLSQLSPGLDKVMYASDGACAVEMAMKMSLHLRILQGQGDRQQFIALENSYHGETLGALSVTDLGLYRSSYQALLSDKVSFLQGIPYVSGESDPLWHNCEAAWPAIEKQLAPLAGTATALIVEPIVQGAAGMRCYSKDFLKRLRNWTKQHDIHLIADEIMTGLGRTGELLACDHATVRPDFLCLGKGLTGGWLPLSAMLTSNEVYSTFLEDHEKGKQFLHSHTYTGNALAASVANEMLSLSQSPTFLPQARALGDSLRAAMETIAEETQCLQNVRGIGAWIAADLVVLDSGRRAGFEVYQAAVARGALLRPLGNTIYWLPPLNMDHNTLEQLQEITQQSIVSVMKKGKKTVKSL